MAGKTMRANGWKKGNILLVANYASDVGYAWWLMENFWSAIDAHFSRAGTRCVLVYPQVRAVPDVIRDSNIEVLEHDYSDRRVVSLLRLLRLIRMHRIRNVYLTDREYYGFIYLLLRLYGVRCIVQHDHKPGEREPARGLVRLLKRAIHSIGILSCDYYVGVSDFVRQRLVNSTCIPPQKCGFVLNGIPPYREEKADGPGVREEFDIPGDAIVVVSTGRATYYKGIDFIIECARQLVVGKQARQLYFLHCGSGPDMEAFQSLAAAAGLGRHFIFAGHRSDIRRILLSCDIAIQASRGEAFSLSILEYMGAGLATLAPAICGNAEAIEHERSGILFSQGDAESVVRWIGKLAADPGYRERLGSAAREAVQTRFTIERANRDLLEILDRQFC